MKKVLFALTFVLFTGCASRQAVDISDIEYMPKESAKQFLNEYFPPGWVDQPWWRGGQVAGCNAKKYKGKLSDVGTVTYFPSPYPSAPTGVVSIIKNGGGATWCGRSIQIKNVSKTEAENIYKALVSLGASKAIFKVW